MPQALVRLVEERTLARIIRDNTSIGDELPRNVFSVDRDRQRRRLR